MEFKSLRVPPFLWCSKIKKQLYRVSFNWKSVQIKYRAIFFSRLYEAHRRVQRVNQGLEDKLLKLVDVSETDKNTLTKDIATLSHKLAEANYTIKKLTEDNVSYGSLIKLSNEKHF